jgi:hypothetical protein
MTDADLRRLFALLERPVDPPPEFVESLLNDIDAVAAPTGATPGRNGGVDLATEPVGPPERPYFAERTDHSPLGFGGPRAHRRRVIGVLAAAAAVIVAALGVVVTRPGTDHQHNTPPVAPSTTATPTTTGVPTTPAPGPAATVVVTPNTGLTDPQVVHIVGEGLVPGETYTVAECANGSFPADLVGECFIDNSPSVTADGMGHISTNLKVQKVFPGPDPTRHVDCAVGTGCLVALGRHEANGGISYVYTWISFGA